MKTSILTIFALAASVASAQTLTISGDTSISESAAYNAISITATSDATVSIADDAMLTINAQVPMNNFTTKKITFEGGTFWQNNTSAYGSKYVTNSKSDLVFNLDYTYEVSSTAEKNYGPSDFLIGGGKITFAKNFNYVNSISGSSAKLHFSIGYVSSGAGGTSTVILGTAQQSITDSTPKYSLVAGGSTINNASTLIINNNYSFSSGAFVFADTASKVENYGTFSNTGADDIKGTFTNAGTATFTAAEVIVSGSYTNTGGSTTFGNATTVSGTYTNSGGTTKFGTNAILSGAYSNTGGTTIFTGGTWIENGAKLVVGGDNSAVVGDNGSTIVVKSGGTIELDGGKLSSGVSLNTGSTLSIKKASTTFWVNVADGATIEMWASSTYTYSLFGNTTVKVLADNLTLLSMAWKESGSHEVDIVLNGHSFNLGDMKRGDGFTGEDLFIDFILAENESWKDNSVKTTMSEAKLNEITFKINGVITEFDFVATTGGFYLNTVVPEPAEWAMIFGAVALAFVAYRRRR